MKGDLISHNVVTDPGQFITQGLGRHDRISLGGLSIIVASKSRIMPACKLGSFDKCPAQIFITVFTVTLAAELGITDLLADGPLTAEELAKRTNTHSDARYRVLRALASVGIFAQNEALRFSSTPLADLLRSDSLSTQRSFAIMMGGEFYAAWGELLNSMRTGEIGFQKRFGVSFFQYMTEHPERHGIYDSAMTGVHGFI